MSVGLGGVGVRLVGPGQGEGGGGLSSGANYNVLIVSLIQFS